MNLLVAVAHFLYEHRASAIATASIVFTAFLYTSPEPGTPCTREVLYGWVRGALFLIFNRHPQPAEAAPIPKQ